MSSIGKIYTYPNNWRVARARAAAVLGGADIEEIWVTMDVVKSPEMLEKFPAGCVPCFEAKDGTRIHQSAAIATYAALAAPSGKLLSDDKAVAARIAEWTAFADQEIAIPHGILLGMIAGRLAYAKPTYTSVLAKIEQKLEFLNKNLEDKTYLVGDRITLADIFVASATFGAFTRSGQLDKAIRSKYNNVVRHMETVVKSPKLAEVFGEWEYVETAAQYQAPKKDAKPKAEKKPDAPKAEKAPKAPKAPKEKKPVEKDDDEEEPDVPAEPKQEHPCASLPPSSFNLENWKRVYSNSDSPEAMKYFVENLDREGYSVWRTDYKYNDELTQVFMSSNLIGGLFARLEGSRKYREFCFSRRIMFGSMGVLGTSNDSVISGVMVSRGQDIEATMNVAPDWTSYEFTRLDLDKAEDKEFIEKAFDWTLEIDGKKWADGKNFK